MSISCERNLRNERIANEDEKDSATRIATIVTMLTTIYCVITLLSSRLEMR